MSVSCSSCGAQIPDGADQCVLCGTPVGGTADRGSRPDPTPVTEADAETVSVEAKAPVRVEGETPESVFCTQCGTRNPGGSRFCSACGAALHHPTRTGETRPFTAPEAAAETPAAAAPAEASVGKRLGMIFGAALLVVVAFFMIDAVSGGDDAAQPATMSNQPPPVVGTDTPLPDAIAAQLEEIRADAETLTGDDRIARLRDAVDLLLGIGRFDRAAIEQEAIAEITNTEADWAQTGNHYYDWMDQQFGAERASFAVRAIAAYRRALEINPDNLDVRTDMAVAYMSDPDNPMQAISENAAVLEQDSLHVQANFNRGIMLVQINRVEQALSQFRKVQRIVNDPEEPIYQLAEQAIRSLEGGGGGLQAN